MITKFALCDDLRREQTHGYTHRVHVDLSARPGGYLVRVASAIVPEKPGRGPVDAASFFFPSVYLLDASGERDGSGVTCPRFAGNVFFVPALYREGAAAAADVCVEFVARGLRVEDYLTRVSCVIELVDVKRPSSGAARKKYNKTRAKMKEHQQTVSLGLAKEATQRALSDLKALSKEFTGIKKVPKWHRHFRLNGEPREARDIRADVWHAAERDLDLEYDQMEYFDTVAETSPVQEAALAARVLERGARAIRAWLPVLDSDDRVVVETLARAVADGDVGPTTFLGLPYSRVDNAFRKLMAAIDKCVGECAWKPNKCM